MAKEYTLKELDASFIRLEKRHGTTYMPHVADDDKKNAMGVMFDCPKCFGANDGKFAHAVICWSSSAGAPADASPGPGRWKMDGTCLSDLTLNSEVEGGARSVLLGAGCGWHGYVTDGKAV